jgi:hypothetical protein
MFYAFKDLATDIFIHFESHKNIFEALFNASFIFIWILFFIVFIQQNLSCFFAKRLLILICQKYDNIDKSFNVCFKPITRNEVSN